MTHLFAEPATRFFALYGNTDDFIATPQLRVINLRLWLAEYCRSLGYKRVVFYSADKKIHFVDESSARLAQPGREAPAPKAPAGQRGFKSLGKFGVPPGYPRLGVGRRAEPENIPAGNAASESAVADVPMAIAGDDAQTGRRLDAYMRDSEIPTVLVFQHAEDVIGHLDQDARRSWNEAFHRWQSLPPGNRNICICVFGRQPDFDHLGRDVLCARFIDKDRKWFADNCFNVGAARQDEVGHLLDALRLKGKIAWTPTQIERAAQPLAQSLTPDEISEPLLTLPRLHDRILETREAPPVADDPWEELRAMPALDRQVGEELRQLVADVLSQQQRQREKHPESPPPPACVPHLVERLQPPRKAPPGNGPNLHIALLGSPGTGKTTLARLVGRIFKREGLLSSGHFIEAKASDLIAGYVGQTMNKTAELIQRAMGGVLFIDEAYALAKKEGSYADECVAELVASMTRYGDFAVIIAGYTKEINDFLSSPETNPGLARRFPNRWTLKNYTGPELQTIFLGMAAKDGYRPSDPLLAALPKAFDAWARGQDAERFGNAGAVKNLWEHVRRQADERTIVEAADFTGQSVWEILLGLREIPTLEEALRPLDGLVGLTGIRGRMRKLYASLKSRYLRYGSLAGMPPGHYLFVGKPGVGKTTVAELMAEMLLGMGVLEQGDCVKRRASMLLESHPPEKLIRKALDEASGKILFIDEAHQLADEHNPFGRSVLNVLIPEMENRRNSLCVILAGYPQGMERLKAMDAGLASRLTEVVFDDYEPAELLEIAEKLVRADGRSLTPEARDRLIRLLAYHHAKRDETFANARFVRELLDEEVFPAADARGGVLDNENPLTEDEAREACAVIQIADLPVPADFRPEDWNDAVSGNAAVDPETALAKLDDLIGLASVRQQVRALADSINMQKARARGVKVLPGHFIFSGNPGTGKTTVAREMGQVFRSLGVLARGHVVEATSADLIGQYVGETVQKLRQKVTEALDGILFIDEAYGLVTENAGSYGQQAVDELVAQMEKHRDRLCVIAAGYSKNMKDFLQANPGLPSRFDTEIAFPDYSAEELRQIASSMFAAKGYSLAAAADTALLQVLQGWDTRRNDPDFGNARDVRNLVNRVISRQAQRLAPRLDEASEAERDEITAEDLVGA